jgi:hypothetical protein
MIDHQISNALIPVAAELAQAGYGDHYAVTYKLEKIIARQLAEAARAEFLLQHDPEVPKAGG